MKWVLVGLAFVLVLFAALCIAWMPLLLVHASRSRLGPSGHRIFRIVAVLWGLAGTVGAFAAALPIIGLR